MTTFPHFARAGLAGAMMLSALMLPAASASAEAERRTPDHACQAGQPSLIVEVTGFSNDSGTVRAQIYGPGGARFLDKGQWAMRIEQVRHGPGPMRFCFPVMQPGDYAVAVRHDANANGKSDWNDGGGFTRNPHLSLLHLKPAFAQSAVSVKDRAVSVPVVMQYRSGLSIGPLAR